MPWRNIWQNQLVGITTVEESGDWNYLREEDMKVNVDRVMSRLEELYQCGAQEDGTFTRMAFSQEDVKGRTLFMNYFKELGITSRVDEAGNIIARLEGSDPKLPAILMGSHLDTVPDGGRFDGAVGCVSALGVCEALVQSNTRTRHPIEVIVFTDEEGFRFGNGLLGSSAICGIDPHISETDLDLYGHPRGEVMRSYGIQVSQVGLAKRDPREVHCFLELHVEQGATLDKTNTSVGVVSSIAGVSRFEIVIQGQANHSGSTAMVDRKDALVAAADFIRQVPEVAASCGNQFTVATVGTIKVTPNSVNVIPGTCTFSLEFRDQDNGVMASMESSFKKLLQTVCEKYGTVAECKPVSYHAPAPMSPWVRDTVEQSVKELGYDYQILPSGAFHDALIMTSTFPTGMIFIPSVGGISHSRYEVTNKEDIERGCNVLLQTVQNIDKM